MDNNVDINQVNANNQMDETDEFVHHLENKQRVIIIYIYYDYNI